MAYFTMDIKIAGLNFKSTYRKIDFGQSSIQLYFQRPILVNAGGVIGWPWVWDGGISVSYIPVSAKCFPEILG